MCDSSILIYHRTLWPNNGEARLIPPNSKKHWSVARLRACHAAGASALQWVDHNDKNKNFVEVDLKRELQMSFFDKNSETNGV